MAASSPTSFCLLLALHYWAAAVVLSCVSGPAAAVDVDNGVRNARLECTESHVRLVATLNRPLTSAARIYVKGHATDRGCVLQYLPSAHNHNALLFQVPIGGCGMARAVQTGFAGGRTTYVTTYVVSFHDIFVTKVDRAFRLTCAYGFERTQSDVTAAISVSDVPTTELPMSQVDASARCAYSVHLDTAARPAVRYARIGDRLLHRWQCDGLAGTQFMWVRNCRVSPEFGEGIAVVDERGCTLDTVAMGELEYGAPPHHSVTSRTWAYKFADMPTLLYRCEITVCDRRQPTACTYADGSPVQVPPVCRRRSQRTARELPSVEGTDSSGEEMSMGNQSAIVSMGGGGDPARFEVLAEPLEVAGPLYGVTQDNDRGYIADADWAHGGDVTSRSALGQCKVTVWMGALLSLVFSLALVCVCLVVAMAVRARRCKCGSIRKTIEAAFGDSRVWK